MTALRACRVVLVRPRIAANVGAAARVMRNLGFEQLVLVAPEADPDDPRGLPVRAAPRLAARDEPGPVAAPAGAVRGPGADVRAGARRPGGDSLPLRRQGRRAVARAAPPDRQGATE